MTSTNPYPSIIRRLSVPFVPEKTAVAPVLNPLSDIRAVLVDIYGTVLMSGSGDVGTVSAHQPALDFAKALEAHGLHCDEDVAEQGPLRIKEKILQTQQRLITEGIDVPEINILTIWTDVLQELFPQQSPLDIESIALSYECRVNPVWPMPNVKKSLARLSSAYPLGIVSNAQFYTPLILETLLEETLDTLGFGPLLCSWSWKASRSKPSLKIFDGPLTELRKRAIEAHHVVYIGNDMLNDVWTAKQCGCRTVLFAGDQRSLRMREQDERCQHLIPDAVITDWQQLPEILELPDE